MAASKDKPAAPKAPVKLVTTDSKGTKTLGHKPPPKLTKGPKPVK